MKSFILSLILSLLIISLCSISDLITASYLYSSIYSTPSILYLNIGYNELLTPFEGGI